MITFLKWKRIGFYQCLPGFGRLLAKPIPILFVLMHVTPQTTDLTNNIPIYQRPQRFAEPINNEIERQCKELETLDFIEQGQSLGSSNKPANCNNTVTAVNVRIMDHDDVI